MLHLLGCRNFKFIRFANWVWVSVIVFCEEMKEETLFEYELMMNNITDTTIYSIFLLTFSIKFQSVMLYLTNVFETLFATLTEDCFLIGNKIFAIKLIILISCLTFCVNPWLHSDRTLISFTTCRSLIFTLKCSGNISVAVNQIISYTSFKSFFYFMNSIFKPLLFVSEWCISITGKKINKYDSGYKEKKKKTFDTLQFYGGRGI